MERIDKNIKIVFEYTLFIKELLQTMSTIPEKSPIVSINQSITICFFCIPLINLRYNVYNANITFLYNPRTSKVLNKFLYS